MFVVVAVYSAGNIVQHRDRDRDREDFFGFVSESVSPLMNENEKNQEKELSSPVSPQQSSFSLSQPDTQSVPAGAEAIQNITPQPFVLWENLENGEVYSNGTHFRATITTRAIRTLDNETNTYTYYQLFNRSGVYYLKSAYGLWRLSKTDGVVLMRKVNGAWQKVYTSENWTLVYNGTAEAPVSRQIEVLQKNNENLSISVVKTYPDGWLNITYSWIKGQLKISVGLKAKNAGNFRVALKIIGLDNFTKRDLYHYNTSRYAINFDDMASKIDETQSSFSNGVLTLVSVNMALSSGAIRTLDPTTYETSDEDDFALRQDTSGNYYVASGNYLAVGNFTGDENAYRSFVRFKLDFIGSYSKISSTLLNLTMGIINNIDSTTNISVLGIDITKEPFSESNIVANSSTFNEQYLQNGTNYNITIRLGDQASPAIDQEYYWNVTNFVQEWIRGRTVNYIGWQIRQINDVGATADQKEGAFYDAQHTTGQAPQLTIEWVSDTLPPYISSNQSTTWTTQNVFNITAYDQPTSSASGLNLSTLAYSLNGADWITVPTANIISQGDNSSFKMWYVVNLSLSQGQQTIAWRISDLQGNWGYTNSSFGKQYYPKFTGDYAFHNSTAQIGWGEDWTEDESIPTSYSGTYNVNPSVSWVNGIYSKAIQVTFDAQSDGSAFLHLQTNNHDVSEYSKIVFWLYSNVTQNLRQVLLREGSTGNYYTFYANITISAGWQKLNISLASITGSPENSWDKIWFYHELENTPTLFKIDGLHFENEDGDSVTENLTPLDGTWQITNAITTSLTMDTDSELGYESIKAEVYDTDNNQEIYLGGTAIDLSVYNTLTFRAKGNETNPISFVQIDTGGGGVRRWTGLTDITTSWQTYTLTYSSASLVEGNHNLSSIIQYFLIRINDNDFILYLDAINFYKSNQSVYYDTIAPTISSVTVSENMLNPWDNMAWDGSVLWYSNDQSMSTPLNITVSASDATSGISSYNTSTEWNDGTNVSTSASSVTFNYTISQSETSTGNITLSVYDQAGNVANYYINATLDNTLPVSFSISLQFTTVYTNCMVVNTTTSDSGAGLYTITIEVNDLKQNVSSGVNQYCALLPGIWDVNATAYDYVGNPTVATNAGSIYVQAIYDPTTITTIPELFDPLDAGERIFDQVGEELIFIFLLFIGALLVWRMMKK